LLILSQKKKKETARFPTKELLAPPVNNIEFPAHPPAKGLEKHCLEKPSAASSKEHVEHFISTAEGQSAPKSNSNEINQRASSHSEILVVCGFPFEGE